MFFLTFAVHVKSLAGFVREIPKSSYPISKSSFHECRWSKKSKYARVSSNLRTFETKVKCLWFSFISLLIRGWHPFDLCRHPMGFCVSGFSFRFISEMGCVEKYSKVMIGRGFIFGNKLSKYLSVAVSETKWL